MNSNMVGSHYVLTVLPIWATGLLLYILTMGAIFILRDRYEGMFYNTSYSAMIGDGALVVVGLMAAEILKRGGLAPNWAWGEHIASITVGIFVGVAWWALDRPPHWGDVYHHLVIAPVLVYLGITLLPVIFEKGTKLEVIATVCLIALWAALVVYDAKSGRLAQRRYLAEQGVHIYQK